MHGNASEMNLAAIGAFSGREDTETKNSRMD